MVGRALVRLTRPAEGSGSGHSEVIVSRWSPEQSPVLSWGRGEVTDCVTHALEWERRCDKGGATRVKALIPACPVRRGLRHDDHIRCPNHVEHLVKGPDIQCRMEERVGRGRGWEMLGSTVTSWLGCMHGRDHGRGANDVRVTPLRPRRRNVRLISVFSLLLISVEKISLLLCLIRTDPDPHPLSPPC
ncbi:hypothetical protein PIB30_066054 [Stylosanthes scabra]|uniref:Uncharacterized protein n=1 Tax=Stylosanthes scabra TaxID=79078 RepID=A0ABU6ZL07_9FABA|nr:hypothetical protein [Stylosanthes scabra]